LSLWELAAAVDGYNRAQGGEEQPPEITAAEFDDLLERHADWMATVH
jgi:hypothetical protein